MPKTSVVKAIIPEKVTIEGQLAISSAPLADVVPEGGAVAESGVVPDAVGDGKVSVTEFMLQNCCAISCQKLIFERDANIL